jgi:hypothetical protein
VRTKEQPTLPTRPQSPRQQGLAPCTAIRWTSAMQRLKISTSSMRRLNATAVSVSGVARDYATPNPAGNRAAQFKSRKREDGPQTERCQPTTKHQQPQRTPRSSQHHHGKRINTVDDVGSGSGAYFTVNGLTSVSRRRKEKDPARLSWWDQTVKIARLREKRVSRGDGASPY